MTHSLNEGTLRQRRNLFLVGFVMLLSIRGELSFEGFTLGAASVRIGNPLVVYELLWVLFAYFGIRYHQYFMEFEKESALVRLWELLDKRCVPLINEQMVPLNYHGEPEQYASFRNLKMVSLRKATIAAVGWSVNPKSPALMASEIRILPLLMPFLKSLLEWLFKLPYFTDLILPYVFAIMVFLVALFSDWPGSPLW